MWNKFINRFKKEVWHTTKEEIVNVHVAYFGTPVTTLKATLICEESNKGNVRHWMNEHSGHYKGRPYLVDIETRRPVKDIPGQHPY